MREPQGQDEMEGAGREARAGRYDSTRSRAHGPDHPARALPSRPTAARTPARVATRPTPGRSLVTRRAVADVVRAATLGSYGVTGFAGGPLARLGARLGLLSPGLRVGLGNGIDVELDLTVASGVPIAEVARQVDSAVRYAVAHAIGQEVHRVVIHVDGLRVVPGDALPPPASAESAAIGPQDLADSGTDVA